eukprot:scaffold35698_cov63-Attheya_sp.AAC.8
MKLFWTDFHIEVWNLNKAFTSFKGVDIKVFISNIPNVINFIKTKFTTSAFLENVYEGLSLWSSISKFIHIVEIPDEDAYLIELSQFETNFSSFYACGQKTFLSKNRDGDDEFFYSHCLRFYLPRMARDIFEKQKVGLGVFMIQGYEHRNKESKNTMKQFTNKKGNLAVQNLKRLWDAFFHSKNAY